MKYAKLQVIISYPACFYNTKRRRYPARAVEGVKFGASFTGSWKQHQEKATTKCPFSLIHVLKANTVLFGYKRGRGFGSVFRHQS